MTKSQQAINIRFIQVCDNLIEYKKVKHKTELSVILTGNTHLLARIYKCTSRPTLKHFEILLKTFGVDANYIFGKSEDMFLNSTQTQHKQKTN